MANGLVILKRGRCAAPPALRIFSSRISQRLRTGLTCGAPLALGKLPAGGGCGTDTKVDGESFGDLETREVCRTSGASDSFVSSYFLKSSSSLRDSCLYG